MGSNPVNLTDPLGLQVVIPGDLRPPSIDIDDFDINSPFDSQPSNSDPSGSDTGSPADELILEFAVYTYSPQICLPPGEEDPFEQSFNDAVDLFTTTVRQNVTTLHEPSIADILMQCRNILSISLPPMFVRMLRHCMRPR